MKLIRFDETEKEPNQGNSSKGDQPKWKKGTKWYKADHMGYESLSEVLISHLLKKSNVLDFVHYDPILIQYQNKEINGCMSKNFLTKDEMLITFERLHRIHQGKGLSAVLGEMPDVEERIQYTVEFLENTTGIQNVGAYLTMLLELDAFFLNEDRHTNNLAVIRNMKTENFRLCPVFDNGLSLLSDLNDYPLEKDIYLCVQSVYAKPFSTDFEKQVDTAEELYGSFLKFTFTKEDIYKEIESLKAFYDERICERVIQILFEQMRKYRIFFC